VSVNFSDLVRAWDADDFVERFKAVVERMGPADLPLQGALSGGSRVGAAGVSVMVLGREADSTRYTVRAGVFFTGVEAGSCCADDPSPPSECPEYCEVLVVIDRQSGTARVSLADSGVDHA
jgi:hypothetical protein